MRRTVSITALAFAILAGCTSKPAASTGPRSPTASVTVSAIAFLQQLRKGFANPKFRVTYGVQQTGVALGSIVTVAQDLPEVSFKGVSGADTRLVIQDAHNTVVCYAAGSCVRSRGNANRLSGPDTDYILPLLDVRNFVESKHSLPGYASKGSQTIAGRAATCASWLNGPTTIDACSDDETGVVLSFQLVGYLNPTLTNAVLQSWTANAFGTPTAADFKPTGPVGQAPPF